MLTLLPAVLAVLFIGLTCLNLGWSEVGRVAVKKLPNIIAARQGDLTRQEWLERRHADDGEAWDLLQQLLNDPASLRPPHVVFCAALTVVTNEVDFVEEWLVSWEL